MQLAKRTRRSEEDPYSLYGYLCCKVRLSGVFEGRYDRFLQLRSHTLRTNYFEPELGVGYLEHILQCVMCVTAVWYLLVAPHVYAQTTVLYCTVLYCTTVRNRRREDKPAYKAHGYYGNFAQSGVIVVLLWCLGPSLRVDEALSAVP